MLPILIALLSPAHAEPPEPTKVVVTGSCEGMSTPEYRFEAGTTKPTERTATDIAAAATLIVEHSELKLIEVRGRVSQGEAPNLALQRAEATIERLTKSGVKPERLKAVDEGVGESPGISFQVVDPA